MSQLELVWELENRNNELDNYRKKLNTLNSNIELKLLEKKLYVSNNQYTELCVKLEDYKIQIYKYSNLLKKYEFQLREIDNDLYNGMVSDLKQLDYLNKEKDKLNRLIEDTETMILTLMETVDVLDVEVVNIKNELNSIEQEIRNLKNKINKITEELNKLISNEQEFIKSHVENIDASLLNRYNTLRKSRGTGIVYVRNYICSGCNMHIPTSLAERLKSKTEIIYCESCGRILYYVMDNQ